MGERGLLPKDMPDPADLERAIRSKTNALLRERWKTWKGNAKEVGGDPAVRREMLEKLDQRAIDGWSQEAAVRAVEAGKEEFAKRSLAEGRDIWGVIQPSASACSYCREFAGMTKRPGGATDGVQIKGSWYRAKSPPFHAACGCGISWQEGDPHYEADPFESPEPAAKPKYQYGSNNLTPIGATPSVYKIYGGKKEFDAFFREELWGGGDRELDGALKMLEAKGGVKLTKGDLGRWYFDKRQIKAFITDPHSWGHKNPKSVRPTLRHEIGHAIAYMGAPDWDDDAGWQKKRDGQLVNRGAMGEAIEKFEAKWTTRTRAEMGKEWKDLRRLMAKGDTLDEDRHAVADIFAALTATRAETFNDKRPLGAWGAVVPDGANKEVIGTGHSLDYYNNWGRSLARGEIAANLMDLKYTNNPQRRRAYQLLREAPQTRAIVLGFEEALKEVADQYVPED